MRFLGSFDWAAEPRRWRRSSTPAGGCGHWRMDRPDEPKQRVPGPRSHAERRFSGTAGGPRAHAAAAGLAPVARHAGGTRPARPRTRGGDRQPAAVTYEAIADRKIGHAALRPEICSGIVVGMSH